MNKQIMQTINSAFSARPADSNLILTILQQNKNQHTKREQLIVQTWKLGKQSIQLSRGQLILTQFLQKDCLHC